MDKLKEWLNFTGADGKVVTYFGGRVTRSQLLAIVLCIVAVLVVLKVLKGIIKTVVVAGVVCVALVHFGIASPQQLKDVALQIQEKGVQAYNALADASENIKLDGSSIMVKIDGKWVDVTDISSIIPTSMGASVNVNGEDVAVADEVVVELLDSFRK